MAAPSERMAVPTAYHSAGGPGGRLACVSAIRWVAVSDMAAPQKLPPSRLVQPEDLAGREVVRVRMEEVRGGVMGGGTATRRAPALALSGRVARQREVRRGADLQEEKERQPNTRGFPSFCGGYMYMYTRTCTCTCTCCNM